MNKNNLLNYFNQNAVSGSEAEIGKYIISIFEKQGITEYKNDSLGNLYFSYNLQKSNNVALCAHMDETGFIVSQIKNDGTVSIANQGGFKPFWLINSRVTLINAKGIKYNGLIYYLEKAESSIKEMSKIKNYFADFGFKNKDDAEKKYFVKPGDAIYFDNKPSILVNDRMIAKSVDNRVSVAILCENINKIFQIAKENNYGIYFIFTSQEEVGLRGSKLISSNINADLFLNMDISPIKDTTNKKATTNNSSLGDGAHIRVFDSVYITKHHVIKFLEKVANDNKIKHIHFLSGGGTDSGTIALSKQGYVVIPMTFGYRYNHGPSQLFDFNDLLEQEKFLIAILKALNQIEIGKMAKPFNFKL